MSTFTVIAQQDFHFIVMGVFQSFSCTSTQHKTSRKTNQQHMKVKFNHILAFVKLFSVFNKMSFALLIDQCSFSIIDVLLFFQQMIKTSLVPLKMPWIFPTMLLNVSKNIC
jgi:hypothetical protein